MTTVSQGLRAIGVVTASKLLDPAPGVPGDLDNLGSALPLADEPEDLVVAAYDGVVGLAVAFLQFFRVKVRLELYSLRHNAPLYTRTWYQTGARSYKSVRTTMTEQRA